MKYNSHYQRFSLRISIMDEIYICCAEEQDLKEILNLQYQAFESEAALFGRRDIPPLVQTICDLKEEFRNNTTFLKLVIDNIIVSSVRIRFDRLTDTVFVGKLMTHPMYRGRGYGTLMLREIESLFPHKRYELFTSSKSLNNIRLYENVGYREFARKTISDDLVFVYMEKIL